MHVEINSVWQLDSIDSIPNGKYRVLQHCPELESIILFKLTSKHRIRKPILISYSVFLQGVKTKNCIPATYPTPSYQVTAEESIPRKHRERRDKNWKLIQGLVQQPEYLEEILTGQRNKKVSNYAKAQNTYVQKIYRLLNLYWQFGQNLNSLLPAYKLSGGSGTSRIAGEAKRGAPLKEYAPNLTMVSGKNITESDKLIFKKAMRKYGFTGKKVTLSRVYDNMLKEFYSEEIILAETKGYEPALPTLRAFRYWISKLFRADEIIRRQTTKGDYERNKRGLRGSATDNTEVIGSCFEIDATVIDVHVVSEFNRSLVLGRPTLYCVIDKKSRMVTGIHVSLEFASWRAGRQALVNSFTPKKEYCARFGITIEESEWPCSHIPQRLVCDRGEFICKKPEELAVPLIGHISIAPPYRPDLKGIVERFFKTLNSRLLHELKGTTNGRHYNRGERDPRLDAQLTITEVTALLIDEVLEHNNSSVIERLAHQSTLFVESSLPPTPLNYWSLHLDNHQHALSKIDESEIYAYLLPSETVSMTGEGIRLSDSLCYECDHPNFEAWKSIARTNGRWQLEARIDHDSASYIYVRLKHNEGFTKCNLVLRSSNFENKHIADVQYFHGWIKQEQKRARPDSKSIERHNRRQEIVSSAAQIQKQTQATSTKSEKTRGIKQNRRRAIEHSRTLGDDKVHSDQRAVLKEKPHNPPHNLDNTSNVVSMLKRVRRDRSEN
ncbi:transposase [Idiomarina sp. UBA4520]|uniref:transposase n=1 Tax=Idiomarina sp. UBA4520 TaxID=1946647 RepID=UPI000C532603|nr:transposase [Idiomarina sp. UBA4520]MBF38324.1 transposase [Idiomarinaceae bacterium]